MVGLSCGIRVCRDGRIFVDFAACDRYLTVHTAAVFGTAEDAAGHTGRREACRRNIRAFHFTAADRPAGQRGTLGRLGGIPLIGKTHVAADNTAGHRSTRYRGARHLAVRHFRAAADDTARAVGGTDARDDDVAVCDRRKRDARDRAGMTVGRDDGTADFDTGHDHGGCHAVDCCVGQDLAGQNARAAARVIVRRCSADCRRQRIGCGGCKGTIVKRQILNHSARCQLREETDQRLIRRNSQILD